MGDWVGVVKGSEGGWGIGEPLAIVRQPEGSQFSETIRDGVGGRGQGGGGEGVRRKVKKYFQLNPLPPFCPHPFLFLPTFCPKLFFLSNISFFVYFHNLFTFVSQSHKFSKFLVFYSTFLLFVLCRFYLSINSSFFKLYSFCFFCSILFFFLFSLHLLHFFSLVFSLFSL